MPCDRSVVCVASVHGDAMITINAQTKEVLNAKEHEPQVFGHFGHNITPGYIRAWCKPNYPMPAKRLRTFDSLVNLGRVSAENNFDINVVFENFIKL